jgi:16S rRNA (cytidine1402-2'-O)-methyltransferase
MMAAKAYNKGTNTGLLMYLHSHLNRTSMQQKQAVYMLPLTISEGAVQTLPPAIAAFTEQLGVFFVEDVRTARRFIRLICPNKTIENLEFSVMDKHSGADLQLFRKLLKSGHSIGIMSEAGCPGIADPGAQLAGIAHEMNVAVVPVTGPSSILLSLMASGLNGQSFAFNGYLPVKEPMRSQRIKELETRSAKELQTQLFIETPYRNNLMLTELLKNCSGKTKLCIALDITGDNEYIKTTTIDQWKKAIPVLGKYPAVFMILG